MDYIWGYLFYFLAFLVEVATGVLFIYLSKKIESKKEKFCSKCGEKVLDNYKYCKECGRELHVGYNEAGAVVFKVLGIMIIIHSVISFMFFVLIMLLGLVL